jgi:hypothetical protein
VVLCVTNTTVTQLGTLGAARGKLVLLQRFTYQFLSSPPSNPFGIHLDAEQWTPNGGDIKLVYNKEPKRVAYIQVRKVTSSVNELTFRRAGHIHAVGPSAFQRRRQHHVEI